MEVPAPAQRTLEAWVPQLGLAPRRELLAPRLTGLSFPRGRRKLLRPLRTLLDSRKSASQGKTIFFSGNSGGSFTVRWMPSRGGIPSLPFFFSFRSLYKSSGLSFKSKQALLFVGKGNLQHSRERIITEFVITLPCQHGLLQVTEEIKFTHLCGLYLSKVMGQVKTP